MEESKTKLSITSHFLFDLAKLTYAGVILTPFVSLIVETDVLYRARAFTIASGGFIGMVVEFAIGMFFYYLDKKINYKKQNTND